MFVIEFNLHANSSLFSKPAQTREWCVIYHTSVLSVWHNLFAFVVFSFCVQKLNVVNLSSLYSTQLEESTSFDSSIVIVVQLSNVLQRPKHIFHHPQTAALIWCAVHTYISLHVPRSVESKWRDLSRITNVFDVSVILQMSSPFSRAVT